MTSCDAKNCNDSASQRIRTRGVELWLCDLHVTGLNDALHIASHTHDRRPVTKKRNRFDDAERTDQRARGSA